jgi:hypothetical protein
VFVLHPQGRPDVRLALTGRDLLRLKAALDGFVGMPDRAGVAEAAAAIASKLGDYFAGLK